jgi:enterochelin esterase-like enzyme
MLPGLSGRRPGVDVRALLGRGWVLGAVAAALVFAAIFVTGSVEQSNRTLGEMGFDPDRSQLISGLLVDAIVAAAAVMAGGRIWIATLLGCLAAAVLFGSTFVRETQSAVASTGTAGSFDLGGWLITLPTLLVSGLIAGWAGAALATVARPVISEAILTAGSAARRRPVERRAAARAGAVALVALVLIVTVPVFGDIVNYTPDSHMLHGQGPLIGLGGPALTAPPIRPPIRPTKPSPSQLSVTPSGASPAVTASASVPTDTAATPSPTARDPHPWLAWKPSGYGQLVDVNMPGPWSNPNPAILTIYTPPGYTTDTERRYPVLYQAPYYYYHWNDATNVNNVLQNLMDAGLMPATIVVSMDTEGGTYTDSECADSFDGREWFDTYVATTVIPWIDAHYRTIATASSRGILGASQGGYCAAALAVHHPDLFGSSLVFSGYFHAGMLGAPSTLPFGGNKAYIDAQSPDVGIFNLPPSEQASLYFVLVAKLSQSLYGPEATRFDEMLNAAGIDHMLIDSATPHGWAQLRIEFAGVMEAWSARMVSTGVFDQTQ